MEIALDDLFQRVDEEIENGNHILILSDRKVNENFAAIPSLLALSALHHHLIQTGYRSKVNLIVESGEPREVHHFAALLGYGANAIHPYLVFESIYAFINRRCYNQLNHSENYMKSVTKGIIEDYVQNGYFNSKVIWVLKSLKLLGISHERN